MGLSEADLAYFQRGDKENGRFFQRLGGEPTFEGLRVLDVGCGHGSMCIYIAARGASKVVGVDIEESRTAFARENLGVDYPQFEGICEFRCCGVESVPETDFDIVLSKDSFEHIMDPAACLKEMSDRLRPGGRIYIGFGPLYNSPFGDHKSIGIRRIPWSHLLLPEALLLRRASKKRGREIQSVREFGVNQISCRDHERIFRESGLEIEYLKVNASRNPVSRLFTLLRRIPPLRDYLSHNLYVVLRSPL